MNKTGIGEIIKKELKENPGRPFIIAFMILLIIAAAELAVGNSTIANKLAEIAYYYLVIGVVLTIYSVVREERRKIKERSKEGASGPSTAVSRGLSDPSTAVGVGVFHFRVLVSPGEPPQLWPGYPRLNTNKTTTT